MKIIAISNQIPQEKKKGDQLLAFQHLNYMVNQGYSIDLICFQSKNLDEDNKVMQELEKKGIKVHFIKFSVLEIAFNLCKSLLNNSLPLQCALFKSNEFSKKIKKIYKIKKVDAIYCVMIRVAPNIDWYEGKLFVEMIDSMGLNLHSRIQKTRGLKRWILKKEQEKVTIYEKKLADKSYCSFVVSSIDKNYIGSSKVKVIPLGVNVNKKPRIIKKRPSVIFTGNMFYQPNIDAVTWFVKYCWSDILTEQPQAQFLIVGQNPSSTILSLPKKNSSIKVTGRVPSVTDLLNEATVAVAPMQSGSGMQNKILEAMACAIPVVCTTLGVGDIRAIPGKEVLVEDTAKGFSKKVIDIIKLKKQNYVIGKNGQNYINQNHNWENLNKIFLKSMN